MVAGHSWGTLVALALAERHQADVAGLVLLSGYYFWTLRPDALMGRVAQRDFTSGLSRNGT